MQDTYSINDTISFVGLGKLGLPLATIFAKNGVDVIGIDKNKDIINLLNEVEGFDYILVSTPPANQKDLFLELLNSNKKIIKGFETPPVK